MSRAPRIAASVACSVAAATISLPAAAGPGGRAPITTIDGPELLAILVDAEQSPELTTDADGDPMIKATHNQISYTVLFYGCSNHVACTAIQFRAWWDLAAPVSLDVINTWNRTSLLGRAYLDKDSDPTIDHTVRLKGGVTLEHLRASLTWFQAAARDFETALLEPAPPPAP
jgi:hypothetical protein